MKKHTAGLILALTAMAFIAPTAVLAQTRDVPGASSRIGDQDNHGNYWDGYSWRTPQWWHNHQGKQVGERNQRGEYWDGGRWSPKPSAAHQDNTRQEKGRQSSQSQGLSHNKPVNHDTGKTSAGNVSHEKNTGNEGGKSNHDGNKNQQNQGENNIVLPKSPQ